MSGDEKYRHVEVKSLTVKPGDRVILTMGADVPREDVQGMAEHLQREFPDVTFVFVAGVDGVNLLGPPDTGGRQDPEGLDNLFTYHPPQGDDVEAYQRIRNAGRALADAIVRDVPRSRERSTAIAKIREAVMWANAGRACNPEE